MPRKSVSRRLWSGQRANAAFSLGSPRGSRSGSVSCQRYSTGKKRRACRKWRPPALSSFQDSGPAVGTSP
eukprot:1969017-Rhodomonas_salina.2